MGKGDEEITGVDGFFIIIVILLIIIVASLRGWSFPKNIRTRTSTCTRNTNKNRMNQQHTQLWLKLKHCLVAIWAPYSTNAVV